MSDKQKPCPFCGGDSHLEKQLRDGYEPGDDDLDAWAYWIQCNSCAGSGPWAKNPFGAFRQWNTRTPSNTACTPTNGGLAQADDLSTPAAIRG